MNALHFEMLGKRNALFRVTPEVIDIKGAINERKGKIQEMLTRNNLYGVNNSNNGRKGNNMFNRFQSASKTINWDSYSKYTTPFKQGKTTSKLMLLSPSRSNNTYRRVESAFASTKCTLFSSNSSSKNNKNEVHTKSINVLSQFNTSIGVHSKHKRKRKCKRNNITLTLTLPGVSRTQSMFYTITTQCKQQYKRGLNISTSINSKYKRNATQTRSKHIFKDNQQDIQALTENIHSNSNNTCDSDVNRKQIVNLDIKHVDKVSDESVYKNRNLYLNCVSQDHSHKHNNEYNGMSIYSTATKSNCLENKALFIKHFRQFNTQKSFYIVERLLRLSTKYKDNLIKLTKPKSPKQQQQQRSKHKQRFQSV